MKAKTYEVCNREKVEWQDVIFIVSNCSDLTEDCNTQVASTERKAVSQKSMSVDITQ